MSLYIQLVDADGLAWCQSQVIAHHYLHKRVDVRCSPVAYQIMLQDEVVGCLIFGRPESTKCNGWYGSVADVASGACRMTRWQVLNLARVWLSPDVQKGGSHYIENAATWVIAQALRRIVVDFLMVRPPVWMEEPYEIREVLSYCQSDIHQGTIYKAANFRLVRENARGIQTYARPVRRLSHAEKAQIARRSQESERCKRLRSERMQKQQQLCLFGSEEAS